MSIFNTAPAGADGKTRVFSVLDGSALPDYDREGTIAIVSPLSVKTVYVQLESPQTPATGDVWLAQGNGRLLYSAGKTVRVSVTVTRQFDGESWKTVHAYQRANGEWISGVVYLLEGNDDCVSLTGGWARHGTYGGRSEKVDGGYMLTEKNGGNQRGSIQTANKISLSGVKSIYCKGTITSAALPVRFGIQEQKQPGVPTAYNDYSTEYTWYYSDKSKYAEAPAVIGDFEIVLDVSRYNDGSFYVGVNSGSTSMITEIWAMYE